MAKLQGVEIMSRVAATNRVLLYQSGSTLFEDTFEDADSTALASHTPTGAAVNQAAWATYGDQDLIISSNKADSSNVVGDSINLINVQNEDVTLDCVCTNASHDFNISMDIIVRAVNKDNYVAIRITQAFGFNVFSVNIGEVVNGNYTGKEVIVSDGALIDSQVTLHVVCSGASVIATATIAGTDYTATHTSTVLSNGTQVGISCADPDQTVDSMTVTKT